MRWSSVRGLVFGGVLVLTFLVLNGVDLGEAGGEKGLFEWFAEIWIPLVVGVGTVLVSTAALVATKRATDLAHSVEQERERAADERASEARSERLRNMAVAEARALTAWAVVVADDRDWESRSLAAVGEARHGPTLQHLAQVMLQQSLVPGAAEVFELTGLEVRSFYEYLPDAWHMPDAKRSASLSMNASSRLLDEEVRAFRKSRILARLRQWALNPEVSVVSLQDEVRRSRTDVESFMDYRQGLSVRGLKARTEYPDIPREYGPRALWLGDNGYLTSSR